MNIDPTGAIVVTSIPSCSEANRNKVYNVQLSNTSDFTVKCMNNRGVYMLYPMPPKTPGALRVVYDGLTEDNVLARLDAGTGGWAYQAGETGHPGILTAQTGATASSETVATLNVGATSSATCPINASDSYDYEAIVRPTTDITQIEVGVGMFSDIDDATDTHMAFFEYTSAEATVTDATNASPIVVTVSATHGYDTGDVVTITGVVGNTAANGTFTITDTGATTFSLDGSTGDGAYVSGGASVATNWKAISRDADYPTSQTKTDTGVAFTINTWYRVLIRHDSGTINYYIVSGNADYGSPIVHTTDIPTTELCPEVYIKNVDAADKKIDIDMMAFQMEGISR